MTKKTGLAYSAVFDIFSTTVAPHIHPETFHVDFEAAIRNEIRRIYPNATIIYCFFHFCQALWKKIKARGKVFIERLASWNLALAFYRKLMAIALLPVDNIHEAFNNLIQQTAPDVLEFFGADFINNYFERYWLDRVTPQGFSVYGERNRTSNPIEAYHHRMRVRMGSHPGIWVLMKNSQSCIEEIARPKRDRKPRLPYSPNSSPKKSRIVDKIPKNSPSDTLHTKAQELLENDTTDDETSKSEYEEDHLKRKRNFVTIINKLNNQENNYRPNIINIPSSGSQRSAYSNDSIEMRILENITNKQNKKQQQPLLKLQRISGYSKTNEAEAQGFGENNQDITSLDNNYLAGNQQSSVNNEQGNQQKVIFNNSEKKNDCQAEAQKGPALQTQNNPDQAIIVNNIIDNNHQLVENNNNNDQPQPNIINNTNNQQTETEVPPVNHVRENQQERVNVIVANEINNHNNNHNIQDNEPNETILINNIDNDNNEQGDATEHEARQENEQEEMIVINNVINNNENNNNGQVLQNQGDQYNRINNNNNILAQRRPATQGHRQPNWIDELPPDVEHEDQLYGPDHEGGMMQNIRHNIFCRNHIYLDAIRSSSGTTIARRLMDGVFKPEIIQSCTLTGQTARNGGVRNPVTPPRRLHIKAIEAIIECAMNNARFRRLVAQNRDKYNKAIASKICEIKAKLKTNNANNHIRLAQ